MNILHRSFYERDTVTVAQDLLGKVLMRTYGGTILSGIIVETEAYGGADDPASHAYRNKTQRNAPMFGPPGHAYVYFTYGMHYCFNIVAHQDRGAVLVRAIKPLGGIELMRELRGYKPDKILTDGPAKLTQALAIGPEISGHDMTEKSELVVFDALPHNQQVIVTPRIGISVAQERPWRFLLPEVKHVTY